MTAPKKKTPLTAYYATPEELHRAVSRYFDKLEEGELPTVAGLLLHLDISRTTWAMWGRDPRFAEVVEHGRLRMLHPLEKELISRDKGSMQGLIFSLQNNFGWRTKTEMEIGEETRAAAAMLLPLSQKVLVLQDAAMDFQKALPVHVTVAEDEGEAKPATEIDLKEVAKQIYEATAPLPRKSTHGKPGVDRHAQKREKDEAEQRIKKMEAKAEKERLAAQGIKRPRGRPKKNPDPVEADG